MFSIVVSKRFKKNLKVFLKKHPDLTLSIEEQMNLLQIDPFDHRLKTHPLTGKLKGTHALSISYEYRLVFSVHKDEIWLLAIGTHDEVY